MIKRESFFSIIIGLFLLIISPLIVHAAPEEIQPVKAGEYHCVSYPGIGTRVLTTVPGTGRHGIFFVGRKKWVRTEE